MLLRFLTFWILEISCCFNEFHNSWIDILFLTFGLKDSNFELTLWPSFCLAEGLENTTVPVNKETVICVDASQAGEGKVTCRIRSPSGNDIDIDIVENPDGTFSLLFTPQMMGAYTINIKFGGQSVPGGEYDIQVRHGQGCCVYLVKSGALWKGSPDCCSQGPSWGVYLMTETGDPHQGFLLSPIVD